MRLKRHKSFGEINATLPERCSLRVISYIITSSEIHKTSIRNLRKIQTQLTLNL